MADGRIHKTRRRPQNACALRGDGDDHTFRLDAERSPRDGLNTYLSGVERLTFAFLSVQDDSVDIGTAKSGPAPP